MSNEWSHHDGAGTWYVDAPTWRQAGLCIPSGALTGHDLFFSYFLFGWDRARTWPAIYLHECVLLGEASSLSLLFSIDISPGPV